MAAAARLTANGAPAALASTPTMAAMSVALGCWRDGRARVRPCSALKLPRGASPRLSMTTVGTIALATASAPAASPSGLIRRSRFDRVDFVAALGLAHAFLTTNLRSGGCLRCHWACGIGFGGELHGQSWLQLAVGSVGAPCIGHGGSGASPWPPSDGCSPLWSGRTPRTCPSASRRT